MCSVFERPNSESAARVSAYLGAWSKPKRRLTVRSRLFSARPEPGSGPDKGGSPPLKRGLDGNIPADLAEASARASGGARGVGTQGEPAAKMVVNHRTAGGAKGWRHGNHSPGGLFWGSSPLFHPPTGLFQVGWVVFRLRRVEIRGRRVFSTGRWVRDDKLRVISRPARVRGWQWWVRGRHAWVGAGRSWVVNKFGLPIFPRRSMKFPIH
jgi:hypothetical protein